jgi:hypothetical protein
VCDGEAEQSDKWKLHFALTLRQHIRARGVRTWGQRETRAAVAVSIRRRGRLRCLATMRSASGWRKFGQWAVQSGARLH